MPSQEPSKTDDPVVEDKGTEIDYSSIVTVELSASQFFMNIKNPDELKMIEAPFGDTVRIGDMQVRASIYRNSNDSGKVWDLYITIDGTDTFMGEWIPQEGGDEGPVKAALIAADFEDDGFDEADIFLSMDGYRKDATYHYTGDGVDIYDGLVYAVSREALSVLYEKRIASWRLGSMEYSYNQSVFVEKGDEMVLENTFVSPRTSYYQDNMPYEFKVVKSFEFDCMDRESGETTKKTVPVGMIMMLDCFYAPGFMSDGTTYVEFVDSKDSRVSMYGMIDYEWLADSGCINDDIRKVEYMITLCPVDAMVENDAGEFSMQTIEKDTFIRLDSYNLKLGRVSFSTYDGVKGYFTFNAEADEFNSISYVDLFVGYSNAG